MMLKCPHCGQRILGQDLLTGECSFCHQRLTASLQTVDSDDAVAIRPAGASSPPDSSSAGASPENATAQTFLSEEFVSQSAADAPSQAAVSTPDATVTGDDFLAEDQSSLKTIGIYMAAVQGAADRTMECDPNAVREEMAADRTMMLDGPEAGPASDKTLVTESFADLAALSDDKTFVSEDVPEAVIKTLQSHWDEGDAVHTRPGATLKAKEKPARQAKNTLVIKTKSLRDVKVTPAPAVNEAEYELLKVLGEGGMGVVYDARQTSIDRSVALKMIKGPAAENEKQKAKFLAEAVVTGDLDHPNIVPIYDVGKNHNGALFYSMKKVQGTPWDDVIAQKSLAENLDILMRVADAIAFAHARGVVHRDLKPENTMLGEYGEVLVMDWGLAQPSKNFRKSSSISETQSMGGTPAYMAPEMATGPLEKIGPQSDVYLLGAILYEIVTGKPPHQGKNAMKCLMAAARNEIVPTSKTGELIDIARKAMAAEPVDRYADVRSLQAAIREYQSHTESILLSSRAEDDLIEAEKSDAYPAYAKTLFGFEEALELWSGNKRAAAGRTLAKKVYAESARRKGDFDLGLSLLEENEAEFAPLRAQLLADKLEREARAGRLTAVKRMAAGLAVVVFLTVTTAFFWIKYEADNARKAEGIAKSEKKAADEARDQEKDAKQQALAAKDEAEKKRLEAETAQKQEAVARQEAVVSRDLAEKKRQEAEEARKQEELAKRAEEYEAYIARIGLAAAKINENAFETARELLNGCKPELRNWEWGRLMHLCSQSVQTFSARAPLDALAISADGSLYATGGWDGTARIWDRRTGAELHTLKHGGVYVHGVAFSPDGTQLATASDDPAGFVQLWNVGDGQVLRRFSGHEDAALSVAFSRDGSQLLTASYDNSARLWNVVTGEEQQVFRGHTWWVWKAAFSPDEKQVVTVSQDGTAIVWDADSGKHGPAFTGHRGPVYCAAFTPDGQSIATGGFDRRVLVWKPSELQPYQFRKLEQGESVIPPAKFREWTGHATAVRSLSLMNDGNLLLSAGEDNTVRLWDTVSGTLVKTFRGHDSAVRAAVALPDGRSVLSASHDATVRQWSIAGYEELRSLQGRTFEGHADAILSASFSPNQEWVVTASRDRTARTWNGKTGVLKQTFEEGHHFLASTAVFYYRGRGLLTAAVDNTARLWDVGTGTQIRRFDRTGRAAAAVINRDATALFTGGNDQQAQQWDMKTGELIRSFPGHHAEVTAVALSPDERWLLTGDAKGFAVIWDLNTGKRQHELKAHTRRVSQAAFLADGTRALTASGDNTVAQWDRTTGKEITGAILKHPDGVLTMAIIPGTNRVVTACADRVIRLWDTESATVLGTMGPLEEVIHALSVSDDGTRLLVPHAESRVVRLFELATGREIQSPSKDGALSPLIDLKRSGGLLWAATFAPGDDVLTVGGNDARLWDLKSGRERMTFSPHGAVASARFSPDNKLIVTGSWDNSARIWDAETGQAVRKLEGAHTAFVNTATFSPNGQFVLTASDDGTAKLWTVADGQVIRTFAGHADRVRSASFSFDGRSIVTTSSDKTARLWDTVTGDVLRTFSGHQWAVLTADLSRDGSRLITGSEDNVAKVWDVMTGECVLTLAGHTAPIASVAFSPDASRALTGSRDQAAKLWDARTGKEILTLSRHSEDVTSVCFSPDGQQVLTGSRDGTAILWLTVGWKPAPPAAVTVK